MADTSVTFTAVDLSRLPAPKVTELLSFEQIYGEILAALLELKPDFDATVESDPAVMILQARAYRELLLRGWKNYPELGLPHVDLFISPSVNRNQYVFEATI